MVYRVFQFQGGPHASEQLSIINGFGEKIVGPGLDPFNTILNPIQGSHDHDGDEPCLITLLQGATNCEPVHDWHHYIEENQVWGFGSYLSRASCPLVALAVL